MNCKKKDCFNCPYPDCINDYVKKEYDRPAAYIKKQVERQSERIQQRAEAGLCTTCGKRPPRNGYRTCAECQARSRRYANRHNRSIGRVPESLLDGVSLCKRCGKAGISSASGAWNRHEGRWTIHHHTAEFSWITILRGRFAPMQKG